jgi:hypothetical protein
MFSNESNGLNSPFEIMTVNNYHSRRCDIARRRFPRWTIRHVQNKAMGQFIPPPLEQKRPPSSWSLFMSRLLHLFIVTKPTTPHPKRIHITDSKSQRKCSRLDIIIAFEINWTIQKGLLKCLFFAFLFLDV